MKFTDKMKSLISKEEINASTALLADTGSAVLGDPISAGKVMLAIMKSPFFIREQLFWKKLEAFLDGVYLDDNDSSKLRAKLMEYGNKKDDNACRLVEYIDRAETQQKISYLINATRCLLTDFIDLPTYFCICHAITHTLEEDLCFLKNHIKESDIPYNLYTQGLVSSGLMYQSVIDGNGNQKFSFTPVAEFVDQYAVSYNNVERYMNPASIKSNLDTPPQISIPSTELEYIPDEQAIRIISHSKKTEVPQK